MNLLLVCMVISSYVDSLLKAHQQLGKESESVACTWSELSIACIHQCPKIVCKDLDPDSEAWEMLLLFLARIYSGMY